LRSQSTGRPVDREKPQRREEEEEKEKEKEKEEEEEEEKRQEEWEGGGEGPGGGRAMLNKRGIPATSRAARSRLISRDSFDRDRSAHAHLRSAPSDRDTMINEVNARLSFASRQIARSVTS